MLKKTKLCTSLSPGCGGVLLSAGGAAFASNTTPAPANQQLERAEITGSNIPRTDAETALPIQIITKQEIDQSGKGTIAEYLQRAPRSVTSPTNCRSIPAWAIFKGCH